MVFFKHLIDDRCCTAKWLVAEINRIHRLQAAQSMVIDDFHNLSLIYIIYSLVFFIMVYENHFFPVHVKEITT